MEDKPFIPVSEPILSGNEKKYINRCIDSTWISSKGEFVDKFERSFAEFNQAKYAVSVFNGTVALHLALTALEIGKGDEVIVPNISFISTANAVSYTGALPVFAEVRKDDWTIDCKSIEERITSRTKAIIPVHLYGQPADMNTIMKIAKKYSLLVIEDAAEAHGAQVKMHRYSKEPKRQWWKVGTIGDVGCFSFYANKIITTGEGGMLITNRRDLRDRFRLLKNQGQSQKRKYYHSLIGFNYRMTNLQAAIGLAQMEKIDMFIARKRIIAALYEKNLRTIPGVIIQSGSPGTKSVCFMYTILVKKPYPLSRNNLIRVLNGNKIETRPFFYPINLMKPYCNKVSADFKISRYLSSHGLSLPSGVNLSEKEILRITEIIRNQVL